MLQFQYHFSIRDFDNRINSFGFIIILWFQWLSAYSQVLKTGKKKAGED